MAWLDIGSQGDLRAALGSNTSSWLVTGAAGFIGSGLVEALLVAGQTVKGLDNFATGSRANLENVRLRIGARLWSNFIFHEGDIRRQADCGAALEGVGLVLHQAALGSVPRSINDPITTHDVNATGFLTMLDASRRAGVERFVYASSSSVYGDSPDLPKVEHKVGRPLSPYAATKVLDELYAEVFERTYGFATIGLRYFNVFGPRQDPDGAYAAVMPRWISAMAAGRPVEIYGDGETSRDFSYLDNVVQANLRAALIPAAPEGKVYNIALGGRTTLNQLFEKLRDGLARLGYDYAASPIYRPFREGDVQHSEANIGRAATLLGYTPIVDIDAGLAIALPWYVGRHEGRDRPER